MKTNEIIRAINTVDALAAQMDDDMIQVEMLEGVNGQDCIGDQVEKIMPEEVKKYLSFVEEDDSASVVWYRVK